MTISILNSNIVTAFNRDVCGHKTPAIGTKVIESEEFWARTKDLIRSHDSGKDREPGQYFIMAPGLRNALAGGVGLRTDDPADYISRMYRGKVRCFLKREFAEKLTSESFIALIIYTRKAYLLDPDTQKDAEETTRVENSNATHVLVAVLAGTNYMSPDAAIHNIAGGNREWLNYTIEELHAKAKWVEEIDEKFCAVAD